MPKYGIKAVACWKLKTNSQCQSVLGMASHIHYLNELTVFSSSATLNLGAISLSRFCSYANCLWVNKSNSVQPTHLRHGLLACFVQYSVQVLKYVINKQSHEFSNNLGIIIPKWPTCMVRSHDTAWGQGPWNRHRKCMERADSTVQSQL